MSHQPKLRVVQSAEGKPPPHDFDAEAAVVGACMRADIQETDDPLPSIPFLLPSHFHDMAYRQIFTAILAVKESGRPADSVTVGTWLKDKGWIASCGGMAAVIGLVAEALDKSIRPTHVRAYATTVYEKARAREAVNVANLLDAEARLGVLDVQTWLEGHVAALQAIARRSLASPTTRNFDALRALVKKKNEAAGRKSGISTGLLGLDTLLGGGLHSGHKVSIVALPGVGKTSLGGAIAEHVAASGIGVLVFSTEMEREELLDRMIARHARVAAINVAEWKFSRTELERVNASLEATAKWPIAIDDTAGELIDVDMIRDRTRAAAESFLVHHGAPLGLVVVDYVQNLKAIPRLEFSKPHEQIAYSTKALKALGRELGIPVIELAQSKPLEKDRDTGLVERPGKGKIADSSVIEKCANAVIHIWRQREDEPEQLKLVVPKTRGASEGLARVRFEAATQRFTDMAGSEADPDDGQEWTREERD